MNGTPMACSREHEDHDGELACATNRVDRLDDLVLVGSALTAIPLFGFLLAAAFGIRETTVTGLSTVAAISLVAAAATVALAAFHRRADQRLWDHMSAAAEQGCARH